jgi:predicted CXXCH cytochrome family protein
MQTSVVNSPHNLSATGPGAIRAASEQEICIFCHTPHNATPVQPLWNRSTPVSAYRMYSSSRLQAAPGQPTGSSKLCLSCHDGTIALGQVASRAAPIAMVGGVTTLPPGPTNLGTDLSGDHPISFHYDANLAARNPRIKDPAALPPQTRLDANQEMQCTSCHDAHNNAMGDFLVMDNTNSQLCNSCHQVGQTTVNGHAQCADCHQPHKAPSGPFLLKGAKVTDTCLICHSGQSGAGQGANIAVELTKFSRHDTSSPVDEPNHIPNGVTCSDCHAPHTMQTIPAVAPFVAGNFGRITGVNASGAEVEAAQFQYEVCYKCHADQPADLPPSALTVSRIITQQNKRLQFAPSAVSFHPVQGPGKNPDVPSLIPASGLTSASTIYCTDCHSSDASPAAGGAGARGPHGSTHPGLLMARYETADGTAESAAAYALCYRCHDRTSILSDQTFVHNRHVVLSNTPCSACHDAHGISSVQGTVANNSHLINFDSSIVQRDPVTNRLEYTTLGPRAGQCFLSCHGVAHSPKSYP